eukprot:gnl/TRDRNA2_/TRDRNA2_173998_c0_seq3.p1 gnl/TRDRNA2_/TRDRNA2_173998_c0~~gnl/TRDRNA2_/TRDRNA2_173998_c0_seq3.p1  ORF type:complete len:812 (+),score=142.26 gnl/TRDRNA2_/TRDRNA2_173998_c0_seq3:31-2436(+)
MADAATPRMGPLTKAMMEQEPDSRVTAAKAHLERLKRQAGDREVELESEHMDNAAATHLSDRETWTSAAKALTEMMEEMGATSLVSRLEDGNGDIRLTAVKGLQTMGEVGAAALAARLGDSCPDVRRRACLALGGMGEVAALHIGALASLLEDRCAEVRRSAAQGLGRIGVAAATHARHLVALLDDPDAVLRSNAAEALGEMGVVAAPHAHHFAKALDDTDAGVRSIAVWVLGRLSDAAEPYCGKMASLLHPNRDPDSDVRLSAAEALGGLGALAGRQVAALAAACSEDPDPAVRRRCAWAVGRLGEAAVPYAMALAGRLADTNEDVWLGATEALGHMGEPGASALAEKLGEDGLPPEARGRIARALGRLAPEAGNLPQIAAALARCLEDPVASVRGDAAEALGKLGGRAAGPHARMLAALASRIGEPRSTTVRKHAAEAINEAALAGCVTSEAERLADEGLSIGLFGEKLRQEQMEAPGQMGRDAALRRVWTIKPLSLKDDADESDEDYHSIYMCDPHRAGWMGASSALANMGEAGARALVGKLKDPDARVRRRATLSLGRMGVEAAHFAGALRAEVVDDSDAGVRVIGSWALGELMPTEVTDKETSFLMDLDEFAQNGIEVALLEAKTNRKRDLKTESLYTGLLAHQLQSKREAEWIDAAMNLGEMQEVGAATLSSWVSDPDPFFRRRAILAIGWMGEDASQYAWKVALLLEDTDAGVRLGAEWALSELGAVPGQFEGIEKILGHDAMATLNSLDLVSGDGKSRPSQARLHAESRKSVLTADAKAMLQQFGYCASLASY